MTFVYAFEYTKMSRSNCEFPSIYCFAFYQILSDILLCGSHNTP